MANEYRSTWVGFEAYTIGSASLRATWMGLEVYNVGAAEERVTWVGLEVFYARPNPPIQERSYQNNALPFRWKPQFLLDGNEGLNLSVATAPVVVAAPFVPLDIAVAPATRRVQSDFPPAPLALTTVADQPFGPPLVAYLRSPRRYLTEGAPSVALTLQPQPVGVMGASALPKVAWRRRYIDPMRSASRFPPLQRQPFAYLLLASL